MATPSDTSSLALEPDAVGRIKDYLESSLWHLQDEDEDTSLWSPPPGSSHDDVQVVLPVRSTPDGQEHLRLALRAIAWVQQRTLAEVVRDTTLGGADSMSVRIFPDAPSGEAPLETAHGALSALRELIIGSATGVESANGPLVLPSRRPTRADAYASSVLVSTRPGSFILDVSLPLREPGDDPHTLFGQTVTTLHGENAPFGRRVSTRLSSVARAATTLASAVGDGRAEIAQFAADSALSGNATELSALARLGETTQERRRYRVRFAGSPLGRPGASDLIERLDVTPAQQSMLAQAATYLRERQPRADVTVEGLVVRLSRERASGPGEAVVEGTDDDTGTSRRYVVSLTEADYADALRAHREGYRVVVVGDLDTRGTRRSLRSVRSFDVLSRPGEG